MTTPSAFAPSRAASVIRFTGGESTMIGLVPCPQALEQQAGFPRSQERGRVGRKRSCSQIVQYATSSTHARATGVLDPHPASDDVRKTQLWRRERPSYVPRRRSASISKTLTHRWVSEHAKVDRARRLPFPRLRARKTTVCTGWTMRACSRLV